MFLPLTAVVGTAGDMRSKCQQLFSLDYVVEVAVRSCVKKDFMGLSSVPLSLCGVCVFPRVYFQFHACVQRDHQKLSITSFFVFQITCSLLHIFNVDVVEFGAHVFDFGLGAANILEFHTFSCSD